MQEDGIRVQLTEGLHGGMCLWYNIDHAELVS